MKQDEGMGLIAAGGVNLSFLARLPGFLSRLGPIKAYSFRVARQIANSFHAGHAVSHYSALEFCPVIWIWVPEKDLDGTLMDLFAQTPMHDTMIVLCNSARESGSVCPERIRARVASLDPVPEWREQIFVAEGDPDTLRVLRRLLEDNQRRLLEIKPHTKPLFFAGINASGPLLLPWIEAAIESLRSCGLSRAEAVMVSEFLGASALHSYRRAGYKAFTPQIKIILERALDRDLETIRSSDPRLADLYEQGIRIALTRFES